MKMYEEPMIEVEKIMISDVITASLGECIDDCDGYEECRREF